MNGRTAKTIRKAAHLYGIREKQLKQIWQGLNWKERTQAREEIIRDLEKKKEEETYTHLKTAGKSESPVPGVRSATQEADQAAAGTHNTYLPWWRSFIIWIKALFAISAAKEVKIL